MWYFKYFEWLVKTSVMASMLVCIIFAVKFIFKSRLGARWHYYIWFLLLIRLIMPYFPESSVSIYNVFSLMRHNVGVEENISKYTSGFQGVQPEKFDGSTITVPNLSRGKREAQPHSSQNIWKLIFVLWLAGILFFSIHIAIANIRFTSKLKRRQSLPDKNIINIFEECKCRMGIIRKIDIIETPEVRAPAVLGIVHVKLILPDRVRKNFSTSQLEHIFMHELSHLKRHDIVIKWILCILSVMHWFNPILWLAFYRMNEDCELACDALVMSKMDSKDYNEYGNTILSLAESFSKGRYITGMAGMLDNKSQIKKRIVAITKFKSSSYKWSALAAAVIIVMGVAVLTNARTTNGQNVKSPDIKSLDTGDKSQKKADNYNDTIDKCLNAIVENNKPLVGASSNPYDYIKGSRKEYDEILKIGKPALQYILTKFESSNENGLREWVMASVCCDILGKDNPVKDWNSGREWYGKYIGKDISGDISVYDIKDKRFDGNVIVIKDPKRISVGFGRKGENFGGTLEEIAKNSNAVAAVNAGAFYRDSFDKDDIIEHPAGVVMHEGKVIYRENSNKKTKLDIVGFTKEGKLVAGKMSEQQMIKDGVTEAVGIFGPMLIANGKPLIKKEGGNLGIAPRTAIGQKADGAVVLVAINGRLPDSPGATMFDVQNILLQYEAVNAANLDGGSSTAMYYQGNIINKPCAKRSIPSAFIVMPQ